MPANTPRGYPYPLPTEPVAEGAQAIRNLAEALEAKEAGRELAYAENTANVVGGASEPAAATLVQFAAVTFDGGPVEIEYFCPEVSFAAVASVVGWTYLFDGGTSLGIIGVARGPSTTAGGGFAFSARRRFTPSAGSHTYSLRCSQSGGNVTWQAGAGGLGTRFPMYGRIVKV